MLISIFLALNWSLLSTAWEISFGKCQCVLLGPRIAFLLAMVATSFMCPLCHLQRLRQCSCLWRWAGTLSFPSPFAGWKNYGRGRIMFIQVHFIIYTCQKSIPNGSYPCSLSLSFYKSVQISLGRSLLLLLLIFQIGFENNFSQIFLQNWKLEIN